MTDIANETATIDKKTILIVGDWVVDKYCFMVRHNSQTSSHTGLMHFRLSSKEDETILDLCGAGHIARALFQTRAEEGAKFPFNLVGLGHWNKDDTEYIRHLVHANPKSGCPIAKPSSKMKLDICDQSIDIELFTLQPEGPTIQVTRYYHDKGGEFEQLSRVDSEPEQKIESVKKEILNAKDIKDASIRQSDQAVRSTELDTTGEVEIAGLPKDILDKLPAKEKVEAIIVNDLNKGVVTEDFIKSLNSKYPNAGWFVRSKLLEPDWIHHIDKKLEINILGPEITAQLKPWEKWQPNSILTKEAIDALSARPGKCVALISDAHEVIAHFTEKEKKKEKSFCVWGQAKNSPTIISQLGWPTAFFASMASNRIIAKKRNEAKLSIIKYKEENETSEVSDAEEKLTKENLISTIEKSMMIADELAGFPGKKTTLRPRAMRMNAERWEDEEEKWKMARTELGIIRVENKQYLEVYRGSNQLSDYIACIDEKIKIIEEIGQRIRGFRKATTVDYPISILLQADPGAGKTFLVESLAKEFDFRLRRYDITQMIHREELQDMFEMVATIQTGSGKRLMVFVDEINALIEKEQVYGAFLAPLEQGIYVRQGKQFSLKPCVWVFAGTKIDKNEMKKVEKYSDFESRITLVRHIDFDSMRNSLEWEIPRKENNRINQQARDSIKKQALDRFDKQARIEQVYLGAMMIHREHSDVREISEKILKFFYEMDPADIPARKIRKLIRSLQNVQRGQVVTKNCKSWQVEIEGWYEKNDDDLIELKFKGK